MGVADGIMDIIMNNMASQDGTLSTNAHDDLLLRKGFARNPMIFRYDDCKTDVFGSTRTLGWT